MPERKNIRLVLEYDGSRYHGWQRQKGQITIQEVIEEKIQLMTGEPIKLLASGRTDTGVHALHQVCNFFSHSRLDPASIRRGLNSLLPADIFVKQAEEALPDFHSRYSAKSKTYEYRILNREDPDLFLRHYTWHIPKKLNFVEMKKCTALLLGKHDFSSFRSTGSDNRNPVRTVSRAELFESDQGLLYFAFDADGFLRHMVRNIVGTLVEVGRGRSCFDEFAEIFSSRDRKTAGIKAPPQGLYLMKVCY